MISIYNLKLGQLIEVELNCGKVRGIVIGLDSYDKYEDWYEHTGKITWKVCDEYKHLTHPDLIFDSYNEWIINNPGKYKIVK